MAWNPSACWVPGCAEKGVYGCPRGSEGSSKGDFRLAKTDTSTLGLLESPFSFCQYTIDVSEQAGPFRCRSSSGPTYPLAAFTSQQAAMKGPEKLEGMWPRGALQGAEGMRIRRWFQDCDANI